MNDSPQARAFRASCALRTSIAFCSALTSLAAAGCGTDFDPYVSLIDYRVLALRADKPTLAPNERASVDALEFVPDAEASAEHTHSWSWCPISAGPDRGYACAITEEQLQAALDEALGEGTFDVPSYALSTTSSAAFTHEIPPPVLAGFCAALERVQLPSSLSPPSCDLYFPIQIRLDARLGTKSIAAIKELRLLYAEDGPKNENPYFGRAQIRATTEPDSALRELSAETPFTAKRETRYLFRLEVPEAAAETFQEPPELEGGMPVMKREVLAITWFVQSGEMKDSRTTFISGEISAEAAGTNEWTAPKAVDYPASEVRMYFVIRDGRGGIAWLERRIRLED